MVLFAILHRGHAGNSLEIPHEVAFVIDTNTGHDLFNTQESFHQKGGRELHTHLSEVPRWWRAGFSFEQTA